MSSVYPFGSWFWLAHPVALVLRRQTLPKTAQNGQSDVAVGIWISIWIGIGLIGRRFGSRGSHRSTGCGASGGGLAHRNCYRRVLIVALHHLDGAGVARRCGAHLSTLRLVQLPSNLPVNGLRILGVTFRAENGTSFQ